MGTGKTGQTVAEVFPTGRESFGRGSCEENTYKSVLASVMGSAAEH